MIPVIALVGRPNVGKSTLFNCLTRTRDALVHDIAGVTRDRQYGHGRLGSKPFIVIDTGGLAEGDEQIDEHMARQSWLAAEEADVILLIVDAQAGLTHADETIVRRLRQLKKTVYVVVNKVDGMQEDVAMSEFYQLGFEDFFPTSAAHRRGINRVIDTVMQPFPEVTDTPSDEEKGICVAVVGRPNVGKSTLINRLVGEERVIAYDAPGTTRSVIEVPFERDDQLYTLIDTAGVRRRQKVDYGVEKLSVTKSLQAIEQADVVLLVLDAREPLVDQDLHLLDYTLSSGSSLVVVMNKWDGLSDEQKRNIRETMERRLHFLDFVRIHTISARHGTGVGGLLKAVNEAYQSAIRELSTQVLTRILQKAVEMNAPPLVHGRRIKLKYAHSGGHRPQTIVVHGNQTNELPATYQRYLRHTFREELNLVGAPVRLILKTSRNPFQGIKNKLTERQIKKSRRFVKMMKKKYGD